MSHVSRSLVFHLLPAAQSTDTPTKKSVFLRYQFQRMHISLLKFRMTFIVTKYLEKSSSHDPDFPFTVRNELIIWPVRVTRVDKL